MGFACYSIQMPCPAVPTLPGPCNCRAVAQWQQTAQGRTSLAACSLWTSLLVGQAATVQPVTSHLQQQAFVHQAPTSMSTGIFVQPLLFNIFYLIHLKVPPPPPPPVCAPHTPPLQVGRSPFPPQPHPDSVRLWDSVSSCSISSYFSCLITLSTKRAAEHMCAAEAVVLSCLLPKHGSVAVRHTQALDASTWGPVQGKGSCCSDGISLEAGSSAAGLLCCHDSSPHAGGGQLGRRSDPS